MDYAKEVYLMVAGAAIVLVAFALAVLAVMVIYRKRKLEHIREIGELNAGFSRELLQTQVEVQQQTMQQIGQEIHDNVGQKITLAALYVLQLERGAEDLEEKARAISGILDESLSDLRQLSRDLTHAGLADVELYPLIEKECRRAEATGRCTVSLQARHRRIEVPLAVRHIVLRIVQEFLHNSLKHAACSVIEVVLDSTEEGLCIRASDNGKGFLPGDARATGIGLANMHKRAVMIGARLTIDSTPGAGTRMLLCIPVNA